MGDLYQILIKPARVGGACVTQYNAIRPVSIVHCRHRAARFQLKRAAKLTAELENQTHSAIGWNFGEAQAHSRTENAS
jgi:hypothetical protein